MDENKSSTVFVVDDEPAIVATLCAILSRKGYVVHPFTDPLQALAATEAISPDLLLTDVVMPQLNGLLLAEEVVTKCRGCRVLLMSGNATFIQEYAADMKYKLLEKPAAVADILTAIGELLAPQ